MSADPDKLAAAALETLPPPDRLKRKGPPMEDEPESDGMEAAGVMAMEDFEAATSPAEKFAALKRAVQACGDY